VGIYISEEQMNKFVEENDLEDIYEDIYEFTQEFLPIALDYDWVGNAWTGKQEGWVIWAENTTKSIDGDDAGVFRPNSKAVTMGERNALVELGKRITGLELPVEALVARRIS
jgi:hypothetical protein